MIKVTYDAVHGMATPEGIAEKLADEWIQHGNLELVLSTELPIDWLRVAIKKGKLSINNFELFYQPQGLNIEPIKLEVNDQGRVARWPMGFCDQLTHALSQL